MPFLPHKPTDRALVCYSLHHLHPFLAATNSARKPHTKSHVWERAVAPGKTRQGNPNDAERRQSGPELGSAGRVGRRGQGRPRVARPVCGCRPPAEQRRGQGRPGWSRRERPLLERGKASQHTAERPFPQEEGGATRSNKSPHPFFAPSSTRSSKDTCPHPTHPFALTGARHSLYIPPRREQQQQQQQQTEKSNRRKDVECTCVYPYLHRKHKGTSVGTWEGERRQRKKEREREREREREGGVQASILVT